MDQDQLNTDHTLPTVAADDNNVAEQPQSDSQPNAQQYDNTQTPQATNTGLVADDVDLIEKEWVEKAKEIVNSTHNDPYIQNEQINKMKTDYMKKRYDIDIKAGE